jgi:hypothetical protein
MGLARAVTNEEVPPSLRCQGHLLELTVEGLAILAGYLGLPLATAVRYHGLAGGGPATPVGPRRALARNLAHTLGADAVFVAMARAARIHRGQLLEWRNAAACVHGRVRPDGYGLVHLGANEYGFFLEFDRGTVRPAALRAKFAAYQRYRASARAAREYAGFPTILVVTTSQSAEARLADAVASAGAGYDRSLPVFLTTVDRIAAHVLGPLGPVWRQPQDKLRNSWLAAFAQPWGKAEQLSTA